MRIAVFGSTSSEYPVGDEITDAEAVEEFCSSLGEAIAGSPHELLVTSDRDNTADKLVVDGILATQQQSRLVKIRVYRQPNRKEHLPFESLCAANPGLFTYEDFPAANNFVSHLNRLGEADVSIVVGGGSNSYAAGLAAALMNVRLIPVAAFGGAGRLLRAEFKYRLRGAKLPSMDTWNNLSGRPEDVIRAILKEINSFPRIMIVHGRSTDHEIAREILEDLGVTDPIVLRGRFRAGDTVPERFEREALQADAALVLYTPDDVATATLSPAGQIIPEHEQLQLGRARQNVSLEFGWFWGKLGRDRVLLLLRGEQDLPSDLVGLWHYPYNETPAERRAEIAEFIQGIHYRDWGR
jgi:predicted nucleotide-binding protein